MERALIQLVMSAYYYCFEAKGGEADEKFVDLGNSTGKIIQDFSRKSCMVFGIKLISTDPYLKSPSKEMRFFGNIIDRNKDAETLAKLVMQGMGLKTKREFTLISPELLKEVEGDLKTDYNKLRKVVDVLLPKNNNDDELISA